MNNLQTTVELRSSMEKRQAALERLAQTHLLSKSSTVEAVIGQSHRQRLTWLGLLAMPLIFPIALPGMASMVGALCILIALGLCLDQPLSLPAWLARREVSEQIKTHLIKIASRFIRIIAKFAHPRILTLSDKPALMLNGSMLSVAGLSMMIPVPIISFDNVIPALAIVLLSWGLRLRDGLMLLAGYLVTLAAVVSVVLLWWGGALAVTELVSLTRFTSSE